MLADRPGWTGRQSTRIRGFVYTTSRRYLVGIIKRCSVFTTGYLTILNERGEVEVIYPVGWASSMSSTIEFIELFLIGRSARRLSVASHPGWPAVAAIRVGS